MRSVGRERVPLSVIFGASSAPLKPIAGGVVCCL